MSNTTQTKKLPALKGNKYGTLSRALVGRYVAAGLIEGKCEGHYTDDYAFDNANNFGISEKWLPCRLKADAKDWQEGSINFTESDFDTAYRTGRASLNADGTIRFYIHSNLSYTLRIKGAV